ncbi:laccase-5-like [Anneissia japonica]|uniref:laccase-5-like n=1 Tax=Anneissia japonica TaxID=1529436 RepID=UPI0014258988|nr:laccase-5-like [Anneissia japonica]
MFLSLALKVFFFTLNCSLILSLECQAKGRVDASWTQDCLRTCEYPAEPKVCEYVFSAKWFYSMSSYCFDCPLNVDDCYLDGCVALDGSARPVVVTNSTIPGPSIQVCEGDTVRVKLINNLQDHGALTIHWYGMHQEGTNWMDGASMITQCPVVSSSSFTYEFTADPAGTHWWHAHSGYQRCDGMYGSLIVRQAREVQHNGYAYDFDLPEHVMMLADWKSRPAMSTFLMTESPTRYVIPEEQTFSILVNGRANEIPFYDENNNTYFTPLSTFEVDEGMTYRFRVISAAFALCNLQVSIDSHPLTVFAVDGSQVSPKEVDSFVIAPGERYDFLLKATAEPASYCIYTVGTSSTECVDDGVAVLQYSTGSKEIPSCLPVPDVPASLTDTAIFSVLESDPLDTLDLDLYTVDAIYYVSLSLLLTTYYTDDGRRLDSGVLSNFQIDNVNFVFPNSPILSTNRDDIETCYPNQDKSFYDNCAKEVCDCTSVIKLPLGKVVEFIVFNVNEADYSMHMHGNSFRVLTQETIGDEQPLTKDYLEDLDKEGKLSRISPEHALIKDTVNVPAYGYVILRWKTENPGYWLFHCQTNSHLETGQATILQIGEIDEIPLPPDDMPKCGPWVTKS